MEWLDDCPQIDVVIISVHWWSRLKAEAIQDWSGNTIPEAAFGAAVEAGLMETCRRLLAAHIIPVLLYDSPKYLGEDPFERALMNYLHGHRQPVGGVSPEEHARNTQKEHEMIERICKAVPGVETFDAAAPLLICGYYPFCDEQGRFLYRDTNHVSIHGSYRVAKPLLNRILQLLSQHPARSEKIDQKSSEKACQMGKI